MARRGPPLIGSGFLEAQCLITPSPTGEARQAGGVIRSCALTGSKKRPARGQSGSDRLVWYPAKLG